MGKVKKQFLLPAAMALVSIFTIGCGSPVIKTDSAKLYPSHNETPIAINFETSTQLNLQASEHWNRAATDAAFQLSNSINTGSACVSSGSCQRLVVIRSCSTKECSPKSCETEFGKVFYNQFVSALVKSGQRVSIDEKSNGAKVEIDIQPVRFSDNRAQYRYAGVKTDLGDGVWALRDVAFVSDANGEFVKPNSGSDLHWHRSSFSSGKTPANEVVITVTAIGENKDIIARNTSIYYFPASDVGHFSCPTPIATKKDDMSKAKLVNVPVVGDCSAPRCISCPSTAACK